MKKFLVLFIICGLTLSLPAGKKGGGKKGGSSKKSSVTQKATKGKATANKASKEKGNSEKADKDNATKDKKCDKDKKVVTENKQNIADLEVVRVKNKKFEGRSRLSEEEREELIKERIEKRKEIKEELNSK